jgi:hypothetical protein
LQQLIIRPLVAIENNNNNLVARHEITLQPNIQGSYRLILELRNSPYGVLDFEIVSRKVRIQP